MIWIKKQKLKVKFLLNFYDLKQAENLQVCFHSSEINGEKRKPCIIYNTNICINTGILLGYTPMDTYLHTHTDTHTHKNRSLRHSSKTRLILVDGIYYIFQQLLPPLFSRQEERLSASLWLPVGGVGALMRGLGIGRGSVYCNEIPDTSPKRWAK